MDSPALRVDFWFLGLLGLGCYLGGNCLPVLLAVLAHEAGHLFVLLWQGGRVHSLSLGIAGIELSTECSPATPGASYALSLAGGLAGLGLGLLVGRVFPTFLQAGTVLTCCNLLPLPGLDGENLHEAVMAWHQLSPWRAVLATAFWLAIWLLAGWYTLLLLPKSWLSGLLLLLWLRWWIGRRSR